MKLIDLSKNLNPYMPTREMCKHFRNNTIMISHYPSMRIKDLTSKIADQFRICVDNICLNIGSLEGMGLLLKILSKKSIGLFSPTFSGMKNHAEKQNYKITEINLENNFYYNVEVINALAKEVDIIYLCNPNNPTLDEINKGDLLRIIASNNQCHFIIDETIQTFDHKYFEKTLYKEVANFDNLSVLVSYSKVLGIPGLRLGVLFSNKHIVKTINDYNDFYSINCFAVSFLSSFHTFFFNIAGQKQKIKQNFILLKKDINRLYIDKFVMGDGSFILIKLNESCADRLVSYLRRKGIIILSLSRAYPGFDNQWIRISAGTKKDLRRLAQEINRFFNLKTRN